MNNSSSQPTKGTKGLDKIDCVSRVHTISARHCVEVKNFSLICKEHGIGNSILSKTFFVGGYEWAILYYPRGEKDDSSDYMSLFLHFKSISGELRTKFSFSLRDHVTGEAKMTKSTSHTYTKSLTSWGFPKFLLLNSFEASDNFLREDRLTIVCDIKIIMEPLTDSTLHPISLPDSLSKIHDRLGGLLSRRKGVDITIEVAGQTFDAHKIVLAASSPVFEAQIFSQTKEAKENKIKITDMEAPIFEAMLYFIYNNTLPEIVKHSEPAITQHLLVAADRYMLERLRTICEQELCTSLTVNNVSTTLALAEQHNFAHLKSECLRYLSSKVDLGLAIKTDGFEHLLKTCPGVVREIINNMF